jgi:2-polyprenyl-3-methyl-5-hydroxy-6-metoxy-1,4-benzoquinol methylase
MYLECKDYLVSNRNFSIRSCDSCGFKFTSPRPEDERLGSYYASEDYISHNNQSKGLISSIYKLVRNFTLKQKESWISNYVSRGTILDYGCGTGSFIKYCRKKGWGVTGIEPDPGARSFIDNELGLSVYSSQLDLERALEAKKFKAISMWHVLEHIPNLEECLSFLNTRLEDDGVLMVAVPNYKSFDGKHYSANWAAYDVPRHLHHFDRITISTLFKNSGFQLQKTKAMLFDSVYVSLLSEKNKSGNSNFLKSIVIGLWSNFMAIFTKEYSSLVYVFRKAELKK